MRSWRRIIRYCWGINHKAIMEAQINRWLSNMKNKWLISSKCYIIEIRQLWLWNHKLEATSTEILAFQHHNLMTLRNWKLWIINLHKRIVYCLRRSKLWKRSHTNKAKLCSRSQMIMSIHREWKDSSMNWEYRRIAIRSWRRDLARWNAVQTNNMNTW